MCGSLQRGRSKLVVERKDLCLLTTYARRTGCTSKRRGVLVPLGHYVGSDCSRDKHVRITQLSESSIAGCCRTAIGISAIYILSALYKLTHSCTFLPLRYCRFRPAPHYHRLLRFLDSTTHPISVVFVVLFMDNAFPIDSYSARSFERPILLRSRVFDGCLISFVRWQRHEPKTRCAMQGGKLTTDEVA